ncbi:hypothetical protein [Nocardioides panacihumi]|uniref:hypothetical protein n=1 Tax=Nocardioides panacihumi TaxID=400774 RepID=UPI0031E34A22
MTTATHRPTTWSRSDRLARTWPVLTGAVAGVGMSCLEVVWGPRLVLVVAVGFWLFLTLLLWSCLADYGYRVAWSMHLGLVVTVVGAGLVGLTVLSPIVGGVAAAAGACAVVIWRRASVRRRRVMRTPRESTAVRPDQWRVDQEFARLVADLEKGQGRGPSS